MLPCFGPSMSEQLLETLAPGSSLQSAASRRRLFPVDEPYPEPTRALVQEPPFKPVATSNGFFRRPNGGQLWWQMLAPSGSARAVMVFFHGYGDHSSFHLLSIAREYVAALDVIAILVDMPGHGRSDGVHGLLGSWPLLIADLERWCDAVCEPARKGAEGGAMLPLFAYGQSMGGAVLIDLAIRTPARFDGCILLAPMVRISAEVRPPPHVEWVLRHVVCRVPLLRDCALVPPGGNFEAAIFAESAQWRLAEHEERNTLRYTPRATRLSTGVALLDAADGIAKSMEALRSPFLLMHGSADTTTSPELSKELFARAGASDKTLELAQGGRHGLDFGEEPALMERVYGLAFAWLRTRLEPAEARA